MWSFRWRAHLKSWNGALRGPMLCIPSILNINYWLEEAVGLLLSWQQSGKWRSKGNVKRKLQMRLAGMWGLPKATHHMRKSDPNAKRLYKQRQMCMWEGHGDTPSVQLWYKCALGLRFKHRNLQRKSVSGKIPLDMYLLLVFLLLLSFFLCLFFFF